MHTHKKFPQTNYSPNDFNLFVSFSLKYLYTTTVFIPMSVRTVYGSLRKKKRVERISTIVDGKAVRNYTIYDLNNDQAVCSKMFPFAYVDFFSPHLERDFYSLQSIYRAPCYNNQRIQAICGTNNAMLEKTKQYTANQIDCVPLCQCLREVQFISTLDSLNYFIHSNGYILLPYTSKQELMKCHPGLILICISDQSIILHTNTCSCKCGIRGTLCADTHSIHVKRATGVYCINRKKATPMRQIHTNLRKKCI